MIYFHSLKITQEPATSAGSAIRIKVSEPFHTEEGSLEEVFRGLVDANAHPLGAIITKRDAPEIRKVLGLGRDVGMIVEVANSKSSALQLLLPTPFAKLPAK